MRRQLTVISIALLWAAVGWPAQSPGHSAPRSLDHVLDMLRDLRIARVSHPTGKISSSLLPSPAAGPVAGGLTAAPPPLAADGTLGVYLDCSPLGSAELRALQQMGVKIERVHMGRGLVQARVDPSALDTLAGLSWVRAIRNVDRPVVRAGAVTTEGDAASRADVLRSQGVDGTGVVVGVISDGIDSAQDAQLTDDLPAVEIPNDDRCQKGVGDEGTALLEIVHDVAPGAKLLFSGPASSLEMVDAVECLVDAGANVIVDDLGFFREPYFEDGPVAAAVSAAVTAGVSYHSSAGNEAQQHLEEDFFPLAGSNGTAHDFGAGAGDLTDGVVVPAGGTLTCVLQWNDPFGGSGNDYDLIILDANLGLVAESIDPQVGAQDPIEQVVVVNPTDTGQLANVVIDRFAGEARRLELFCLGGAALERGNAAGSIFGHPALSSVVAVGAVDALDPGLDDVEVFSSHGPARIEFPSFEIRAKPDVVAFDGVTISNAGGFPACPPFCAFFGTSAAAPHSAGIAALLLDEEPTLTPAEVQAALTEAAVDIGVPGFDDASGFGRIDALGSAERSTSATSTSTTTTSTSSTSTSTVAAPPCASDDGCADDDACTIDVCDPVRGCVSVPPAGTDGLACLLGRLRAADVCAAGEIDAKTSALVARRVARADTLLAKATRTSRRAARAAALRKVARRVKGVLRRLGRRSARVSVPCGETLARLVTDVRSLALGLVR